MKKIILSVAVVAAGFATTSCTKSYDCDCRTGASYSVSTVKASNASEAAYTCSAKGTAPGTSGSSTDCSLR